MKPVTVAMAVAFATLVPAAAAGSGVSGLHGYVMRGPVMPVCFEDVPCDAPVSGATLTFTRTDGLKARTVTRQTGFYRILLPPGRYSVTTSARTTFGFAPREVRVRTERDARLDFYISTGIQ